MRDQNKKLKLPCAGNIWRVDIAHMVKNANLLMVWVNSNAIMKRTNTKRRIVALSRKRVIAFMVLDATLCITRQRVNTNKGKCLKMAIDRYLITPKLGHQAGSSKTEAIN